MSDVIKNVHKPVLAERNEKVDLVLRNSVCKKKPNSEEIECTFIKETPAQYLRRIENGKSKE